MELITIPQLENSYNLSLSYVASVKKRQLSFNSRIIITMPDNVEKLKPTQIMIEIFGSHAIRYMKSVK